MKRFWVLSVVLGFVGAASAQDKPNVVIMLADNVGYGDFGAYGAGEVRIQKAPCSQATGRKADK